MNGPVGVSLVVLDRTFLACSRSLGAAKKGAFAFAPSWMSLTIEVYGVGDVEQSEKEVLLPK